MIKSMDHMELRKETERAIISNLEEQMIRAKEMRNDVAQHISTEKIISCSRRESTMSKR